MTDALDIGTAVVAGVSGIVGRAIASRLIAQGRPVIGLSRTAPKPAVPGLEHRPADLRDAVAVGSALAGAASGVTHVFFAGRAPDPDPQVESDRNLAMLQHVVDGLEAAGAPLAHVQMIHGGKWYGSQLGPYRTPACETDPRSPMPNFYYAQQDWAASRRASGAPWSWSALRPHILAGFSLGYPHNSMGVLAAYGTIRKARGEPLSFPGSRGCFESISQVTDLRLLVEAMVWAATEPSARDRAFNIVCADYFRWRDVWSDVAAFFDLEPGPVREQPLAEAMAGAETHWRELAAAHALIEPDLGRIADWRYGDFMWRVWWDDMLSTAGIRRAGFETPSRVITSREAILGALDAYRAARAIP